MAKSQIIKDFTSSSIGIDIALKKLMVLLHDIGDRSLIDWVKNEISGYKDEDINLPSYRKLSGVFSADYLVGNSYRYTSYTNSSLPLSHLDNEFYENLLAVHLTQSISTLEILAENKESLEKSVPPEFFHIIQEGSNAKITNARVLINFTVIKDLLSKVNAKIVEILLMLENEFGSLDDLDIDISLKKPEELNTIIQNIQVVLYDNSIHIGDNNKIKNSKLITND